MDNPDFREALASAKSNIPVKLYATYESLEAAYRFVIEGQVPTENEDWEVLQQGVGDLLKVPKNILKTFPLTAAKNCRTCFLGSLNNFFKTTRAKKSCAFATRFLFESLPKDDSAAAALRRQQFEQLLRSKHFAEGEKLLAQMARQGDSGGWVKKRREALSWHHLDDYFIKGSVPKHAIIFARHYGQSIMPLFGYSQACRPCW